MNEIVATPLHELHVDLRDLTIPHLGDYFGVWSVYESIFRGMVDGVRLIDLRAHVVAQQERIGQLNSGSRWELSVVDGVAIIRIGGAMMKSVPSMVDGTSTTFVRKMLRAAANDDRVRSILLHIDSPGGTVAGTYDLADDVQRVNAIKPVVAYIEDLGASAAYAVASQARRVLANRSAAVGSIGTFAAVYDYSAYAAKEGIKVYVLRAGDFKGAGTPGTEISREQLDEWQRLVSEFNEFFVRGVASGRRMTLAKVKELADGRVHLASDALSMGLIDEIVNFDQAFETALRAGGKPSRKESSMTTQQDGNQEKVTDAPKAGADGPVKEPETGKQAATLAELEKALPKADSEFLVACLRRGDSLAEAKDAWIGVLEAKSAEAQKKADEAERKASRPGATVDFPTRASGVASAPAGDVTAQWKQRLAELRESGLTPGQAVRKLANENPGLHAAYVAAANAKDHRPLPKYIEEQLATA